ncbi:hypothetical protein CFN79_19065 [Chromobacterium vaccinii]|uniref:hypothetical protein n=1 Tax=Chromobacterium vaccinii TaxID=1108595 RepID=UPI000CE95C7C|nr:hypothetical protein [Chromobacterium vaccinii]AVG17799.1 hypothetical protein CFN79_19065 [Chromobacterium vaccinii]
MTTHGREPWSSRATSQLDQEILDADGNRLAIVTFGDRPPATGDQEPMDWVKANAERIVASSNAYADTPTWVLDIWGSKLTAIHQLKEQNDLLQTALESLLAVFEYHQEPEKIAAVEQARGAIAAAKA